MNIKKEFLDKLKDFSKELTEYVSDKVGDWKVKGFIDIDKSIYTISSDTKIISKILELNKLDKITSVIKDLVFFAEEKWKISSDKGGSGNTANIGSIQYIDNLSKGNGVFKNLGENIFDEYWINQGVLKVPDPNKKGNFKKLTKLTEFLEFKGMSLDKINPMKSKQKNKK